MIWSYCCAKSRKGDSDLTLEGPESRIKNLNRILLEFVTEEQKIGLKEISCLEMIEQVLLASNKGEIAKKDIIQIYKSRLEVNQGSIKNFLIQDFFFTDNTRVKYEFNKVVLFNLLYCGGKDIEKGNFLFNIVENSSSSAVHNHSQKLLIALEAIIYTSSIVVAEILNSNRRFQSQQEDSEFQELFSLYSTNANMLREFANQVASQYLFPNPEERQYLMREDFMKRLEECKYLLLRPHEVRNKYTEYVWQNKARALLPSRSFKRTTKDSEEQKADAMSQSSRQSNAFKNTSHRQSALKKQSGTDFKGDSRSKQRKDKIDKLLPPASPYSKLSIGQDSAINDNSMAVYRYEDQATSKNYQTAISKVSQLQPQVRGYRPEVSSKNFEQTDFGYSPIESPIHGMKETNEIEQEIANQLSKVSVKQDNRESQDTSVSMMSTASNYIFINFQTSRSTVMYTLTQKTCLATSSCNQSQICKHRSQIRQKLKFRSVWLQQKRMLSLNFLSIMLIRTMSERYSSTIKPQYTKKISQISLKGSFSEITQSIVTSKYQKRLIYLDKASLITKEQLQETRQTCITRSYILKRSFTLTLVLQENQTMKPA